MQIRRKRRKSGTPDEGHSEVYFANVLSRLYTVHQSKTECFDLQWILINVRGPLSFGALGTVEGHFHLSRD